MDLSTQSFLTLPPGTPFDGGFFAGRFRIHGKVNALIVAPKADGEHKPTLWIPEYKEVPGAQSYVDGLANTRAMAAAGSKLAQWALDLRIGGKNDWYLPSQDELEVIYRALKPTTEENDCYMRSGINLSAVPPTRPYIPGFPVQTLAEAFQSGGDQAFDDAWYWSSTQYASGSDYAWLQHFDDGLQLYGLTTSQYSARAVRRLEI